MNLLHEKRQQIVGLDALRFLAALLVLSFHLTFWNWTSGADYLGPFPPAYQVLLPFTWFGWVGVEVFFVLSGFVIAYSVERSTPRKFLRHRWERLFPAALVCATMTAAVQLASRDHPGTIHLFNFWLKSILFSPWGPWVDESYWTLSVEVAFYAVIFALLVFNRLNAMPLAMAVIGSISTVFWIVAFLPPQWLGPAFHRSVIEPVESDQPLNTILVRHGCYFSIGVFLWLCLFKPIALHRLFLLLFFTGGGVLQIVFRSGFIGASTAYVFSAAIPVTVWLLALAIIVASVTWNQELLNIAGARGVRLLRQFGLMTYPLYLLHQSIGMKLLHLMHPYLSGVSALGATVIGLLFLTYLVAAFVEPRLRRYGAIAFR